MSTEFCIQQMKSRVTFGSSVIELNWEENLVAIFWSPKNEMQLKYMYLNCQFPVVVFLIDIV